MNPRPVFIPSLIYRILSNPSAVKWAFSFINSGTLQKSVGLPLTLRRGVRKSNLLVPCRGDLSKKGIIFSLISSHDDTANLTKDAVELLLNLPQFKYWIKLLIKKVSRECWPIVILNWTTNPVLCASDLEIFTSKQPSASMNPASQLGS